MCWAFVSRNVASVIPDCLIVCRVPGPGLQDAVVEIESIHLGPNDVPVNLMLDRPIGDRECFQSFPKRDQVLISFVEACLCVVGCTIQKGRSLEGTPVVE